MEPNSVELVLAGARAVERLAVVVAGGVSIWLGYRLFYRVIQDTGSLIAEGGGLKLQLQRIGPGVFFAAFGAGVLAYALSRPLSLDLPTDIASTPGKAQQEAANAAGQGRRYKYADQPRPGADNTETLRLIASINTALHLLETGQRLDRSDPKQRERFAELTSVLERHRDALVANVHPPERMGAYRRLSEQVRSGNLAALENAPKQDREAYEQVQSLVEARIE